MQNVKWFDHIRALVGEGCRVEGCQWEGGGIGSGVSGGASVWGGGGDAYPRNSISRASMVSDDTRPSGNLMVAHSNWINRPADKVLMKGDEEDVLVMKRVCK